MKKYLLFILFVVLFVSVSCSTSKNPADPGYQLSKELIKSGLIEDGKDVSSLKFKSCEYVLAHRNGAEDIYVYKIKYTLKSEEAYGYFSWILNDIEVLEVDEYFYKSAYKKVEDKLVEGEFGKLD